MPSSEDAHSTNHHLNLTRQPSTITKLDRTRLNGHHPKCIWFTGLPGAGKSTLANALEVKLAGLGLHTYLLDGDNIRLGLNKDLGMSLADRDENIRRVSEVAKLMVDAGLVVIAAFISPTLSSRKKARELFEPGEFVEIFVDTSLAECEKRDPKGLYKKARAGLIKEFTGIDNPYERPAMPDVVVDTAHHDVETCVRLLLAQLDLS